MPAWRGTSPIQSINSAVRRRTTRNGLKGETLNGRLALVYRLRKVDLLGMKGNAEMLVWINAESELPAKIAIRDSDPKAATEIRFEAFVWNEPSDVRRFSLNLPDGFQPGTVVTARLAVNRPSPTWLHRPSRMASFATVCPPAFSSTLRGRRSRP